MMSISDWLAGQDANAARAAAIGAACFGSEPVALPLEDQLARSYQSGFCDGQRTAAEEHAMALTKEREVLRHSAAAERCQWLDVEAASMLASVDGKLEAMSSMIERRLAVVLMEFVEERVVEKAIRGFHAMLADFVSQHKSEVVRLSAPPEFHHSLQLLMQDQERRPDIAARDSQEIFANCCDESFETAIGVWTARLREAADD